MDEKPTEWTLPWTYLPLIGFSSFQRGQISSLMRSYRLERSLDSKETTSGLQKVLGIKEAMN